MTRVVRRLAPWALVALAVSAAARPAGDSMAGYTQGAGEPAIVLLHGLGVDHTDWNPIVARLSGRHRVVTLDLPGHGASAPLKDVRVAGVARSLDRSLELLGIRKAILVGHSYSGLVVLEEAAAHPKRAAGVVLVDCGLYTPADSARLAEMDDLLTRRYSIFLYAVFGLMSADSIRAMTLVDRARTVPQPILTAYFRDAWHADLRKRVADVRAPMLLIATPGIWPGGESWESARVRLGFARARDLRTCRVDNSGHFVTLDQPDSLASAIEEFAAGLRR